ncbi:putative nuclear pore protein [Xylariomycetidae sp. FL2044]|nr:putative nuclear pore protein [Xylariomycetidae sp. FL2044]
MAAPMNEPPKLHESAAFNIIQHGHMDLVQAIAYNTFGDRCATGGVDGKIRVFNQHSDGIWRLCDHWEAHGGEILELQWLPATIQPNVLASLGIEGRFKLWAEDPSAAPGRRFSSRRSVIGSDSNAISEIRSGGHPFRSFSIKHDEESKGTYFALLASDGHLTVYESEQPETLTNFTKLDDFQACERPERGQETCFKVRFDPNETPCYNAMHAGVPVDALGLVVSGLQTVKVFRTRNTVQSSFGAETGARQFYLAVEIPAPQHKNLVRDVAWAPGSYIGYDILATACQDGFVRVFRIDTPYDPKTGKKSWEVQEMMGTSTAVGSNQNLNATAAVAAARSAHSKRHPHAAASGIRAEIDKSGTHGERTATGQPGQVVHTVREVSKLDHKSPVWRVGFDADGHILGSVGDAGKLVCYRRAPDGTWAKSSELGMITTTRVTAPPPQV